MLNDIFRLRDSPWRVVLGEVKEEVKGDFPSRHVIGEVGREGGSKDRVEWKGRGQGSGSNKKRKITSTVITTEI